MVAQGSVSHESAEKDSRLTAIRQGSGRKGTETTGLPRRHGANEDARRLWG